MRVATYNVHDCIGRDGRYDPDRIFRVILSLDADVIALQELTLDHAGDLLGKLAQFTRMRITDGTLFSRGIGRYGNVLLTRTPPQFARLHDLAVERREPRGCIEALCTLSDGSQVRVLATHLGLRRRERLAQTQKIKALAAAAPGVPVVILGDLNYWFLRPFLRQFKPSGYSQKTVKSFPTWPLPVAALDRILVNQQLAIKNSYRLVTDDTRIASDHYPVVAELLTGLPAQAVARNSHVPE